MVTIARSLCPAILALATLVLGGCAAWAAPERRVALVIGNGRYEAVARLPNPVPDAEMVAASLRETGFDTVALADDLPREKLIDALRRFAAEASRADWAVIYYAGHGIEMGGVNYLIPTDARLATDRDLQFEAVPLSQALAAVEGARKLRLVILDACRDNPFAARMTRSLGTTRSIGRGLARVEPDVGTLVAYAAKDGQVAEDGEGAHSPFVTSFVRHMSTPGLEVQRLFRRVTSDVLVATNRRQEPFTYGSLPDEDFYFRAPEAAPSIPGEPVPGAATMTPAAGPSAGSAPAAPAAVAARPHAPADPAASGPAPPGAPSLAVDRPAVLAAPAISPAPPKVHPPAAHKVVASVEPRAAPPVREPPASPPVKVRPLVRAKPARKPEPVVVRPRRVAQQAEAPEPRAAVRQVARPHPAPAKASAHCLMFNGERICE